MLDDAPTVGIPRREVRSYALRAAGANLVFAARHPKHARRCLHGAWSYRKGAVLGRIN